MTDERYEQWLRTVCFQRPTPEAYDLSKEAWNEAKKVEREACASLAENSTAIGGALIAEWIRARGAGGEKTFDDVINDNYAGLI